MGAAQSREDFFYSGSTELLPHLHGLRNVKHVAQWESTLVAYVFPVMVTLPIVAIDTDLVVKVLGAIWLSKTETATRIRGRIECILDWATVSGFRQGENPARCRVPLSGEALALLRAVPRQGEVVFSGRKRGTPLSDMSLTEVLRRMQFDDITVHGFRSSFLDWCAEAVANVFSREVCEHALAHRLPDRVEAVYRRGDLFDKHVLLMQAWSDFCTNPTPPAA